MVVGESGIQSWLHACRFPESESPAGFWENLVTGTDMVTENDRRWPVGLHGTPGRFGKLVEYHLFDAPFFAVHGKQAAVSHSHMPLSNCLTWPFQKCL